MTIVAASMIGVGVFTTSGFALTALATPQRVMAAWAVGGLIALCGAISYAALASRFADSGGEYLFLARAIHPAVGLTAGVVSLLAGFTGPIAAAALGLEVYAGPLLEPLQETLVGPTAEPWPPGAIAITAMVAAAALHSLRVGVATRIQDGIVIIKLVLIMAFILAVVGCAYSPEATFPCIGRSADSRVSLFSISQFASQLMWISFSFAGFNAAIYVAGEVRDPAKNLPRALIGGTALVTVIYLLLNAIFLWSAPVSVLTSDENRSAVAATAAMAIGGPALMMLVRIVIVIALMTSISAMVMTGPRVYAKMAEDGFLTQCFAFDSRGASSRPPTFAIWFQVGLSAGVVLVSSLQDLLSYLGLTLSLCSSLAIASLFVLKSRGQIDRLPGFGIPPAIFIVATLFFGALASRGNPASGIAALVSVSIGGLLYPIMRRLQK